MSNGNNKSSLDLGILVGLLLTDGSVTKSGSHRTIKFINKSERLHQIFKEKISCLFGVNEFQEWDDKRWDNVRTTFIRSSRVFGELGAITTFRTKPFENGIFPSAKIPEFVFNMTEKEIREILKIMFTTDGCRQLV
jgi:hypothetical protein